MSKRTYMDVIREVTGELDWFEKQRAKAGPQIQIDLGSFAVPNFPQYGPTLLILEKLSDLASKRLHESMADLFSQLKPARLEVWCDGKRLRIVGSFHEFRELVLRHTTEEERKP